MPEAQSPTLTIQGILGEFAPREEVAEALGAVEEEKEDSSSTPGKEGVGMAGPLLYSKSQMAQLGSPSSFLLICS